MDDRDEGEAIEEALVDYLAKHPRAMDTLEAIAEWWLKRSRSEPEMAALRRVLRLLVERGVLETVGRGERPLYRLRQT